MYHFKNLSSINGALRPGIVHRIDADTTGLLMVAKNDKAHEILAKELSEKKTTRKQVPARSEEARQQQLENLAMNLAEKKLRDGTASSQLICHFLNLTTQKAKLEQEKLKADTQLQMKKVETLDSQARTEELYVSAINAMKKYQGVSEEFYD